MGTHISFCRSISMDKWKAKEIKIMEMGGNKKAQEFYSKNDMYNDGRPNHENPALSKYKMALSKQAMEALEQDKTISKPTKYEENNDREMVEEEKKEDPFMAGFSQPAPAASKVTATEGQTSSSIYSFSNLKQPNQPVNLNAKKLDVDFGGDDFFDSFGIGNKPAKPPKQAANDNPFAVADTNTAEETGPFQLGSGINDKAKAKENDEFIKKKMKELEGRKAISSDDFKQNEDGEHKERFARFSGATAISSADFFGDTKKSDSSQGRASLGSFGRDSFGDKVSEAAIYAADAVAVNARKLKEKASNFWASFSRPSE